jgi:hypothetical protein
MVPELEKMGIRILFNECVAILQAALLGWGPNEYMTISGNIAPAGFPKSAPGSSVGLPSASNSHLPGSRLSSAFHRRTHPLATEEVLMSMSTGFVLGRFAFPVAGAAKKSNNRTRPSRRLPAARVQTVVSCGGFSMAP